MHESLLLEHERLVIAFTIYKYFHISFVLQIIINMKEIQITLDFMLILETNEQNKN